MRIFLRKDPEGLNLHHRLTGRAETSSSVEGCGGACSTPAAQMTAARRISPAELPREWITMWKSLTQPGRRVESQLQKRYLYIASKSLYGEVCSAPHIAFDLSLHFCKSPRLFPGRPITIRCAEEPCERIDSEVVSREQLPQLLRGVATPNPDIAEPTSQPCRQANANANDTNPNIDFTLAMPLALHEGRGGAVPSLLTADVPPTPRAPCVAAGGQTPSSETLRKSLRPLRRRQSRAVAAFAPKTAPRPNV
ncbi:hypothetical protein BDK51DRAFT_46442 [Blyttiomyces helicus]|uniref:Uncharacterized protein n=1 Tax=Blyttiomyces helicus TaxID=388810 RepID=A0A4P9WIB3_9FUNG|nr:hypothetical protein BDK51DRAFT_46442 [Blyttiomyces helicus]|eukprot:RKO92609.1 hypothetical protein BDK51DRAFT_46442 [Blyttiomyces helicus]